MSQKKTVLITGASRGIGLALAQGYAREGAQVIAVCRTPSAALQSLAAELGLQIIQDVDVSQASGVAHLVAQLPDMSLDLVINNAGVLSSEALGDIDYDDVLYQFQVNAMGPLRVTEALNAYLAKGAKVAMITSRMGSVSDNGSGGYYGYRMSKAALNAAAMSLTRDLSARGIAVAILHPGFVQTEMVGHAGNVSAEEAAAGLMQRIEQTNMANSGTFWHANGEVLPW